MNTNTFTRRGFVAGATAAPLLMAAGKAVAQNAASGPATLNPYVNVDPELAAALQKFPMNLNPPNAGNLAALRAGDTNGDILRAPELQPRKMSVPGSPGAPDVSVLIIDPRPGQRNKPGVLYIHGGGYVVGTAGGNVLLAQQMAQAVGGVVVSVDYTLAPEAHFPVALEQNYAALAWLFKNADQLGVDSNRIAVSGDSAGGGHAAMLAIAARDRREFAIAYQLLIYPMLDDRTGSTNPAPPGIGRLVWTEAANEFGWTSLLGVPAGSPSVPPGSVPARVQDLSGLPPAFIGVGAIDLFCEEDMEYARRLVAAGVPTELFVVPGAYHGFFAVAPEAKVSVEFNNVWKTALRRGLGVG